MDGMSVPVDYIAQRLGVSVPDVLRASSSREWEERIDGVPSRSIYVDPADVAAGAPEWDDAEFVIDLSPGMTADDLVEKVWRAMGLDDSPRRSRHPHPHPRRRKPLGDDLAADAKSLGIRVRTLARLVAQGHSADDVRRALPRAMAARRHVSRDEAIQAWYSSSEKR